jgi:hypothetical protein
MWLVLKVMVDDENNRIMDFFHTLCGILQRGLTPIIAFTGCNLHGLSSLSPKIFDTDQEQKE